MRKEIATYIQRCIICMQIKSAIMPEPPHPLPILIGSWQDITVDLVTGLLLVNDVDGVYTVVD